MENLQNLHTHTTFCDGADTPEEMVKAAMEKGFSSLGFSGHSYMHYSPYYAARKDMTEEYKAEVTRLKEKYKDIFEIFLGLEVDMYSAPDMTGYDYLIGSVHYFLIDGTYVAFDRSLEVVKKVINDWFGGDGMAFAKKYYEIMAELPEYGKFDILGHYDLAAKHRDTEALFDESSKEYRSYVTESLEALKGKIPFFEVNTGGIPRGYRKTPYPDPFIIKEMKRLGFGAIISSDCHDARYLDCHFEESRKLLSECGFNERYILTKNGFKAVAL